MVRIFQLTSNDVEILPGLCSLLFDAVHHGASVGFLAPLSLESAQNYWRGVLAELGPNLKLWVAEVGGGLVGSVQLSLCVKENGRHRGEIQKLFVETAHRGQGIASQLMAKAETWAREHHRTLLILDTQAGSVAESVYQRLGWQRAGEIPDYATTPEGVLRPTAFYYKRLGYSLQ